MELQKPSIRDRYLSLLDEISKACISAGRDPGSVRLVAVSKYAEISDIQALYAAGHRLFGESRVQVALEKRPSCPRGIQWHLMGTLQKNKVAKVIGEFSLIHSVDSLALAERIASYSVQAGIETAVLLQFNMSEEPQKHGFFLSEWEAAFQGVVALPGIKLSGLMCMAATGSTESALRGCFGGLREIRDRAELAIGLPLPELSMGMSADFPIAIQEGATLLRVGSRLFQ